MRQIGAEQGCKRMGIIAIERLRWRQDLRLEIINVGIHRGPAVGTLEVPVLAALGRPQKRERYLMGQVVVLDPRKRVPIVEQTEIRGKIQRAHDLVSRLRADLLIIVKAGPEIRAPARRALGFARKGYLLAGAVCNPPYSNVAPKVPLLRSRKSFERQNRIARVSPNVTIAPVECEPGSSVEKQVDLRLVVIRRHG